MDHKKHWFTLIELIVVISVITILTSLWIYSFFWYIQDANDSKRITDIQAIKMHLDSYRRNHSYLYPAWEWGSWTTQIMSGADIIASQSYFNEGLTGKIWMPKVLTDPKTKLPYLYSISRDRTSYQITATLENQTNLISYHPFINTTYADEINYNLIAYVEWTFIPRDKTILPGLLYAVSPEETMSFDIEGVDGDWHPNKAKVILNGQYYNLAYNMKWKVVALWTDLPNVLASVSLVENTSPTINYLSCNWVLNAWYTYYHGENDVEYMNGASLNSQIWWKYKTCDGKTWELKPETWYYYNCANIWAWAIFNSTCQWTGCANGYTVKWGWVAGCKINVNAPALATPQNGAYNLPRSGTLSWYAVSGTNVRYNVYLWTGTPQLVDENTTLKSYSYTNLAYSTTYYWYVEACEWSNCIASITYSFSTLPNPDGTGWTEWTGWETWWSNTPPPEVNNCESGDVVCTANEVIISYVWTSGTPLDGTNNNFWTSTRINDKFYGWEKILQYKIVNNSDWRAKFKMKLWLESGNLNFINAANASFDNSNPLTILDFWKEGIANNFFWKSGNGCIYNSSSGDYEIVWKTTCFITLHARADSSVSSNSQIVWYFQVTNTDTLSTWTSTTYTTQTPLYMKSSWFNATALSIAMTGTWKQALEPSSDIGINDFWTSHRIGWENGLAYWYWKSLTYTLSNTNSQDAFFKIWFNGLNTTYTDAFWNQKNYNFDTKVINQLTWDINNASSWTDIASALDLQNNGTTNIAWKNNSCLPSPSGNNIWYGYIVPKNSDCVITIYFRWDVGIPFYNRNITSLQLANQVIADKNYTYDVTIKARADGWSVPFSQHVQSEMFGWIKLHIDTYGTLVVGMASSEILGWICFDESCWASVVRNEITWELTWYALSEIIWWIKMDWVKLKNDGTMEWYALSEMAGWINFNY